MEAFEHQFPLLLVSGDGLDRLVVGEIQVRFRLGRAVAGDAVAVEEGLHFVREAIVERSDLGGFARAALRRRGPCSQSRQRDEKESQRDTSEHERMPKSVLEEELGVVEEGVHQVLDSLFPIGRFREEIEHFRRFDFVRVAT